MVQFFATFGLFFVVIQYLQFVVGRSPLEAAVALLPLPLVMIPLARNAPRIARRVGFRRLAPVGLAAHRVRAVVIVSQVGVDLTYWLLRPGPGPVRCRDGARRARRRRRPSPSRSPRASRASPRRSTTPPVSSAARSASRSSAASSTSATATAWPTPSTGLPPAVADGAQNSIAFTQSRQVEQLGSAATSSSRRRSRRSSTASAASLLVAAGVVAVTAVVVAFLAPAPTRGRASEGSSADLHAEEKVPSPVP